MTWPTRRRPARTMVFALLLGAASCDQQEPKKVCPASYSEDFARQAQITEMLRTSREGASLKPFLSQPPPMCFGKTPSSVVTDRGVLLLDSRQSDALLSTRVAHLWQHLIDGLPALLNGTGDCDARLEQALSAEARGLDLELRLRRELGDGPRETAPWEVESLYWRTPPNLREKALLDYLRAHPDGAPGIDGLLSAYSRRCAKSKNP